MRPSVRTPVRAYARPCVQGLPPSLKGNVKMHPSLMSPSEHLANRMYLFNYCNSVAERHAVAYMCTLITHTDY